MQTLPIFLLLFGFISLGHGQILNDPAKLEEIQAAFLNDYHKTLKPALQASRPMKTLAGQPPPEGFKDWYDALYLRPFNKNTIRIRNGKELIASIQKSRLIRFGQIENLKDNEHYYCIYLGGAGFFVNVMSASSMHIQLVYTEPEG